MTELIHQEWPHSGYGLPDLSTVSTEELRNRLAEAMTITAQAMRHMAHVWRELENRGEDLSALRSSLTAYLPLIADGRLQAEAVVQHAGNRRLLDALSKLPVEAQDELLITGTVQIYLPHSRQTTPRSIADMSGADIHQVFNGSAIRSPGEQADYLQEKAFSAPNRRDGDSNSSASLRFRYGALELDGARIRTQDGKPIRADELIAALSDHYGVDLAALISK